MAGRTVQVNVRGQSYRLVTSATDEEVQRLEAVVNKKLTEIIAPGRPLPANALLLVAMALAHDLEQARLSAAEAKTRVKASFGRVLERVDGALGSLSAIHPKSSIDVRDVPVRLDGD
jgi:cell division protein ZapA